MIDRVEAIMQEVWDWKRRAEEATQGLSRAALIEFYRAEAEKVQQKLGIDLKSQQAASAASPRPTNR